METGGHVNNQSAREIFIRLYFKIITSYTGEGHRLQPTGNVKWLESPSPAIRDRD